jgi:cell division protein ZapB
MPEHDAVIDRLAKMREYRPAMTDHNSTAALDNELRRLEQHLDDLLGLVHQLQEENRALRNRQENLSTDRASLLQKNEQVRTRVEAIIGRLRTMESG